MGLHLRQQQTLLGLLLWQQQALVRLHLRQQQTLLELAGASLTKRPWRWQAGRPPPRGVLASLQRTGGAWLHVLLRHQMLVDQNAVCTCQKQSLLRGLTLCVFPLPGPHQNRSVESRCVTVRSCCLPALEMCHVS